MYAFPLMKKRTPLNVAGYFAVVLLAASFHYSTLIRIPFFFINLIPINKYALIGYAAVTVAVYFNTHRIIEVVTRYWYTSYNNASKHMTVTFTPQFTIAAAVIFIIMFACRKLLRERNRRNYLYINYAFFTFFFVLMGTRHSILDRLSMYFMLLAPVGIATIVQQLTKKLKEEKPTEYVKRYASKNAVSLVIIMFLITAGGLSIHHYALTMDHHGVVPYDVIWRQPWWTDYLESLERERELQLETSAEEEEVPLEELLEEIPEEVSLEEFLSED
jgi:hypothetical protein